jgi:hypothetical protein
MAQAILFIILLPMLDALRAGPICDYIIGHTDLKVSANDYSRGGCPSLSEDAPYHKELPSRIEALREKFHDVKVLYDAPTSEDVAQWSNKLVVVEEGSFRIAGSSNGSGRIAGVPPVTHFYNMITMEVPTLSHYVLDPLERANRLSDTEIILAKQPVGNFDAMLPEMLPDANFSFTEFAPYCITVGSCEVKETVDPILKDATILFIPHVFPLGHHGYSRECDADRLTAARKWMWRGIGMKEPVAKKRITLIDRGSRTGQTANYHYERPDGGVIENMQEVRDALAQWAAKLGYEVKLVSLESMSFKEQAQEVSQSKILIGFEGAGLAHMINMANNTGVIMLNAADGKIRVDGEISSLARTVGMNLWQHLFRCKTFERDVPLDPKPLRELLEKFVNSLK